MYYTNEGWLDVPALQKNDKNAFKYIVGARGTGKTFNILKYIIDECRRTNSKFIYMRRLQTQAELVMTNDFNPFLALELTLGHDYMFTLKRSKKMTSIYTLRYDPEVQDYIPDAQPIGYIMALASVKDARGMSSKGINYMFYDEFIPEAHERPIKFEGTAFENAIETFNRNRELTGEQPMQVFCASNSTSLANPIFMHLNLILPIEKALNENRNVIKLDQRLTSIYLINDSPISKKKKDTALYKMVGADSDFAMMALSNKFTADHFDNIKSKKLDQYKPICIIGELCIYRHKSKKEWYITSHRSGNPPQYSAGGADLKRWRNDFYYLQLAFMNRHIWFESYMHQALFEEYLQL